MSHSDYSYCHHVNQFIIQLTQLMRRERKEKKRKEKKRKENKRKGKERKEKIDHI